MIFVYMKVCANYINVSAIRHINIKIIFIIIKTIFMSKVITEFITEID